MADAIRPGGLYRNQFGFHDSHGETFTLEEVAEAFPEALSEDDRAELEERAAQEAEAEAAAEAEAKAEKDAKAKAPKEKRDAEKKEPKAAPETPQKEDQGTGAATEDESGATPLPEIFPGRQELEAAGVDTIEKLRAIEDLTSIDGIGQARAEAIQAALQG